MTEEERETRLTQKEKRILKKAHDISERKREESRRLTVQWIKQKIKPKTKETNRGTRERQKRVSDSESSEDNPRRRKERPRINMITVTPSKGVILTPAPGWEEIEGRPGVRRGEVV